jgi:hypothetical protein
MECLSGKHDSALPKGWCMDTKQTPRYLISDELVRVPQSNFSVKAYRSHAGYLQCLAQKHVVFIGDSRVRYQYLMLLSFLRSGEWMRCRDYGSNHIPSPSCMLIDHEVPPYVHSSWNDWYNQSSSVLGEMCDCAKAEPFDLATTHENRFFRMSTRYGLITITYLQNYVRRVKFHTEFPPFSPYTSYEESISMIPPRCQPGNCSHPALDLGSIEALLDVVPKLQPTHVFAQDGWRHDNGKIPLEFGCAVEKFRRLNPGVQASVISHTHTRGQSSDVRTPPHGCNVSVFDRRVLTENVPRSWYADNMHALSILNQEFNHRQLDLICGPVSHTQMC